MDSDSASDLNRKFKKINISSSNNVPNGGFPPIIICNKNDITVEKNKNREFETIKNTVSILDIMKKRKKY